MNTPPIYLQDYPAVLAKAKRGEVLSTYEQFVLREGQSVTRRFEREVQRQVVHEVFVESVVNHVRRESAVAALFKDAFPDDYAAHGERMVFRMGPDLC